LKGAIYTKFPQARIDAITNSVPPFDVVAGAYLLAEASKEFPVGTTFCCVVDPGVGTDRRRIAVETRNGHVFVGPDNGLLAIVAKQNGIVEIREASNRTLWREGEVSQTFQGRDIFGPVSASLARGVALSDVGPALKGMVQLEVQESRVVGDRIEGFVIRTDCYGNLVTNIRAGDLERVGLHKSDEVEVIVGKAHFTAPLKSTYADVPAGQKVVVVQSIGYIEFAIDLGDLAREINEAPHATVMLKKK
jgi:S-adenosylmethionine hydrolase